MPIPVNVELFIISSLRQRVRLHAIVGRNTP
jgi:hypothetical protein